MARCNDKMDGPPTDLSPFGNDLLGNALKFLAGISNMYNKYGSERMLVPVVRGALTKAMVRCNNNAGAKSGWRLLSIVSLRIKNKLG